MMGINKIHCNHFKLNSLIQKLKTTEGLHISKNGLCDYFWNVKELFFKWTRSESITPHHPT